jgi:hypothetical protein
MVEVVEQQERADVLAEISVGGPCVSKPMTLLVAIRPKKLFISHLRAILAATDGKCYGGGAHTEKTAPTGRRILC